jgi:choline dehydrogenase-like flavoprotein
MTDGGSGGMGWSRRELATLAELAETFVRGGAVQRADLFARAVETAADPSQVRQLRLVLRLVEKPLVNLVLARTPRPFRDMSPAARERYLLGWAESRIPLRRTAFHALRKLLTFLAYADPGDGVPNPLLDAIGYRTDDPPVSASPTPIVPLDLGSIPAADPIELDADVVVVGSGAGGGVVAHDLARAGRSVVVVEAGPFVDEGSMPRDEMAGFHQLYLNQGLTATWDGAVTLLAGGAVGGGTLVNWMTCIDSPPDVRADWARDHGIAGWDAPSAEADVQDLERELDVAPATVVPPKDQAILRGAAALGWEAERIRRNASACGDCGSCPFGCRRGTKQSGIRAHLAEAFAAGARIVAGAEVERVVVEAGRATGVEAIVRSRVDGAGDRPNRHLRVRARQIVVAAGALRTPAVLERSGIGHPALGRGLRIHPVPVIGARFREPIDMWRGTMQGARCSQFLRPEAGRSTYILESAPGHPGLLALAFPWRGTDRHADLLLRARHWSPIIAVTRDGGEGRVSLTRAGHVRVDYALDAVGVATLRHAIGSMARLAGAAGAQEILALGSQPRSFGSSGHAPGTSDRAFTVFLDALAAFDFRPNRGTVFSAHQMGTARMGADPRTHVCDPDGRVRTGPSAGSVVPGLYVADTSLFPTALGVNPMITVMALARRVGRTVLAEGYAARASAAGDAAASQAATAAPDNGRQSRQAR